MVLNAVMGFEQTLETLYPRFLEITVHLTIPYTPHRSIGFCFNPKISAQPTPTSPLESQQAAPQDTQQYRKVFIDRGRLRVTRNFQPAAHSAQAPATVDAWVSTAPEKYREEYRVAGEAIKACQRGDTADLTITGKHITHLPALPSIVENLRLVSMHALKRPPDTRQCKNLVSYEAKACPWRELDVGHLSSLQKLDVAGSEKLTHIHGLRRCLLLETLCASYCRNLVSVTLAEQQHVKVLDMDGCSGMHQFPQGLDFLALTHLQMRGVPITGLAEGLVHALSGQFMQALGCNSECGGVPMLQLARLCPVQLGAQDQSMLQRCQQTLQTVSPPRCVLELM
jgi:hypothetical protein